MKKRPFSFISLVFALLSSCSGADKTNIAKHHIFDKKPEEVSHIVMRFIPYMGNNCQARESINKDNSPQTLVLTDTLKDRFIDELNHGINYDDRPYSKPSGCYVFLRIDITLTTDTVWGFEIYTYTLYKTAFSINNTLYRAIGDFIGHFWHYYKYLYEHQD